MKEFDGHNEEHMLEHDVDLDKGYKEFGGHTKEQMDELDDVEALFEAAAKAAAQHAEGGGPWIKTRPSQEDDGCLDGVCKMCKGIHFVTDDAAGDVICTGCGTVSESRIIVQTPEWINGAVGVDRSRVGAPMDPLLQVSSTTYFNFKWCHSASVKRVGRYHSQMAMDHKQRSLYHAFKDMSHIASGKMGLPTSIVFQAKEMYKDLKESRLSRGMVHKALIAACVYYACKVQQQEGISRTRQDIGRAFDIPEKAMSSACKIFKEVSVGRAYHSRLFETMEPTDLIHRVLSRFNFDRDTRINVGRPVREMDEKIKSSGIMDGKSPNSVLAAILFIVFQRLGMDIPKADIAKHCETSIVTLNKMVTALGM
jgi:transcription initiation factor TFIIB